MTLLRANSINFFIIKASVEKGMFVYKICDTYYEFGNSCELFKNKFKSLSKFLSHPFYILFKAAIFSYRRPTPAEYSGISAEKKECETNNVNLPTLEKIPSLLFVQASWCVPCVRVNTYYIYPRVMKYAARRGKKGKMNKTIRSTKPAMASAVDKKCDASSSESFIKI